MHLTTSEVVLEDAEFLYIFFFFQAEDGIRDFHVTGVQTCALPILKLRYILHQHLKTRREDGFWPSGRQTRSNLVPSCLPVVQARSRWAPTHLPNNGAEAPRQTPGGS